VISSFGFLIINDRHLYKTPITLTIGPNAQPFSLHLEALLACSPFFTAAFNPHYAFQEALTSTLHLKEINVVDFEYFTQWLYRRSLEHECKSWILLHAPEKGRPRSVPICSILFARVILRPVCKGKPRSLTLNSDNASPGRSPSSLLPPHQALESSRHAPSHGVQECHHRYSRFHCRCHQLRPNTRRYTRCLQRRCRRRHGQIGCIDAGPFRLEEDGTFDQHASGQLA